jgi:hypothetical protein
VGELSHDGLYGTREMLERWNNRLVFPLAELRERYATGHLNLYFLCKVFGKSLFVHLIGAKDGAREPGSRNGDPHVETADSENNFVMLINSVQLMEGEKWMVVRLRTVVRLGIINESESFSRRNAFYLSLVTSNFVFSPWFSGNNGKGDSSFVGSSVTLSRQRPSQVVETRTEMMDDLPSNNGKSWRNAPLDMVSQPFIKRLLLVFGESSLRALLEESSDLGVQIKHALIGPFQLLFDTCKLFRSEKSPGHGSDSMASGLCDFKR